MSRGEINKLYITDPVTVVGLTDSAAKVMLDNEEPVWIPFSLIVEPEEQEVRDMLNDPDGLEITIPEWLAREKGLF